MGDGKRGRPRAFDREKALQNAMELFWQKGFDNTSLSELTACMGLNPPSLYASFKSKEGLFNEALARYEETEGKGIWEHLEEAATAREAVEQLLHASALNFSRQDKPKGCMIVLSAPQMCGSSSTICEELRLKRKRSMQLLHSRLERAKREGELPEQTDCAGLANLVLTFQHGMSIQARDGTSRQTLVKLAEQFISAWECLIHIR